MSPDKTSFTPLENPQISGYSLDNPGTVWLDSSLTIHDKGYQSLLASNPIGEVIIKNGQLSWKYRNTRQCYTGNIWQQFAKLRNQHPGWWIGYISYEATLPFVGLSPNTPHPFLPELHFYFYESVIEMQKDEIRSDFIHDAEQSYAIEITPALTKQQYLEQVQQIQQYIREGDIYQANLTTRFIARTKQNPISVYQRLRELNPAPYAAYMNFGGYQILSSSPERMLSKRANAIVTTPIKGTIARGNSKNDEAENRDRLLRSSKDRAELLMIVDLERNDIGKVAEIGSVTVDPLVRAETYSSLIHLVSDIRAMLRSDKTIDDLLQAILPGGSITGAPKRRAIEILASIEPVPRGVYTGCIGYFHGDDVEFNIAIRTMVHCNGEYHIHTGGGIVADSDPNAEYDEMQLKARNLFRALQPEESAAWG